MSQTYEFEGKNVDHALEKASEELNIPADKIKHEVLTHGSSGIFGLVGVKKARIRVFVAEKETKTSRSHQVESKPEATPVFSNPPVVEIEDTAEKSAQFLSFGVEALQKIIDKITTGATANSTQESEKLLFTIVGGDSGVLIGKRGQTLEAIQYLLEKMINKKSSNRVRVIVDVEGYLQKRKNNLQQMALRMAEKAKRTLKPVTIGQMNAHDRRIVHIHLKNESGVRTQSIGDGYFRKLMIFPKKQAGQKRKKNHETG